MPRSIPTEESLFSLTSISLSQQIEIYPQSDSFLMVAFFILPTISLESLNLTSPIFGSLTIPFFLETFRTLNCLGSGI
jgi:hypothetical protein